MEGNRINCMKCVYFFVTWDKNFPRGCKLFGFKTAKMPYMVVKESSGEDCKSFMSKELKK